MIPTTYAKTIDQVLNAIQDIQKDQIVIKPTVSAGSMLTGRFNAQDSKAIQLAHKIIEQGLTVMVQPFIASVDVQGEVGAVILNGKFSHAFRKGPLLDLGGSFKGGDYQEVFEQVKPTTA